MTALLVDRADGLVAELLEHPPADADTTAVREWQIKAAANWWVQTQSPRAARVLDRLAGRPAPVVDALWEAWTEAIEADTGARVGSEWDDADAVERAARCRVGYALDVVMGRCR